MTDVNIAESLPQQKSANKEREEMMPEMMAMKAECDAFLAKAEEFIGKVKEEDEQD